MKKKTLEIIAVVSTEVLGLGAGFFNGFCASKGISNPEIVEAFAFIGPTAYGALAGLTIGKEYYGDNSERDIAFAGAVCTGIGYALGRGLGNIIN